MNSLQNDHFYYKQLRALAKSFYDDLTDKLYEKEVVYTNEYVIAHNTINEQNNAYLDTLENTCDGDYYDLISTDTVMEIIDFKDYGSDGIYAEVQDISTGECTWIPLSCIRLKEE